MLCFSFLNDTREETQFTQTPIAHIHLRGNTLFWIHLPLVHHCFQHQISNVSVSETIYNIDVYYSRRWLDIGMRQHQIWRATAEIKKSIVQISAVRFFV